MSTAPFLLRVCVTGPESTGKTTLSQRLAQGTGALWVPEASREYAERKAVPLFASDVEPIAREHMMLADAAARAAADVGVAMLVLDADLVSTVVYARHYYGAVSPWIEAEARARRADLYLLCDVDVPWVQDGVRDRPTGRTDMLARFQAALTRIGASVTPVCGDWETRWRTAEAAVRSLALRPR